MDYIRADDAIRLTAELGARFDQIVDGVLYRIAMRIQAGEDPYQAAVAECHRGVAQGDAAFAAAEREIDAVTITGPG